MICLVNMDVNGATTTGPANPEDHATLRTGSAPGASPLGAGPEADSTSTGSDTGSDGKRSGGLDLRPLPERLAEMLGAERPDVLAMVGTEHAQWHDLHDRLIAIVVALLDDAVERGEELAGLLERLITRTSVGVDRLVGAAPTPEAVAALLRSHHSVGTATADPDKVTFVHDCGTGLAFWRRNPTAPTVFEGAVPGVPGGVPRYCARCITTIDAFGQGHWRVRPPQSPEGRCTWEVDGVPHEASRVGGPEPQAPVDHQH